MALTFPNPVFPSDAAVEAFDGTTHQRTGLVFVPKGAGPTSSPTLEVQVNRTLDRLHALVTESNALRAVDEGALLVGVYPGFYTLGGAAKEFAGFTGQSLTDNAVNWVWIDAANALIVSTANFPVDLDTFVPVAKITTASGDITEIEDRRGAGRIIVGGASATMGTDATSFTIDQNNTGAGVSTDVRFNRGTTDDDAAVVWDETNDLFALYLDVVNSELAKLKVKEVQVGAAGALLRFDTGALEVRNVADSAYEDLRVKDLTLTGDSAGLKLDDVADGDGAGGGTYGRVKATDQLAAGVITGTTGDSFMLKSDGDGSSTFKASFKRVAGAVRLLAHDGVTREAIDVLSLRIGGNEVIDSTGAYVSGTLPKVTIPDGSGTSPVAVTIQVTDDAGNALSGVYRFVVSVHDSADFGAGFSVNATIAVTTFGTSIEQLTTNKELYVKTDAQGRVGIQVTDGTPETVYLVTRPHRGSARLDCADSGAVTIN